MEIKFTKKCLDNIIHSKNGIKFNLKGYAFYNDTLPDNLESINDLDVNNVICKGNITDIYDLQDNLFDLTYIPAIESTVVTNDEENPQMVCRFGQYEFDVYKKQVNKDNTNILIIGELFDENTNTVIDLGKSYLVGTIADVDVTEEPKKIVFKVSFTDYSEDDINKNLRIIDANFNDFTENETFKNINTIQLHDNYTLTPDPKNNDFTEEINIIQFDSIDGETNVKQYATNIDLLDKSEKINNIWNVSPRVLVGVDNVDKQVVTPHFELSYGKTEDGKFNTNAVNVQYNTEQNYVSINQNTGNRYIQADIFPEDIDEENKRCIKKKVKRSNLFDYSLVSANKSFFKYDSHNSKYKSETYNTFEFKNKNNTLGDSIYPVENVALFNSTNNSLSGNNNDTLFLKSNNNSFGYCYSNNTIINANDNVFQFGGSEYEEGSTVANYSKSVFHNNVLIGTDTIYSTDINYSAVTANNITFIGKNLYGTYYITSAKDIPMYDALNTMRANVTRTDNSTKSMHLDYGLSGVTFSSKFDIGNEALIGFEGLSVNRLPSYELFYRTSTYVGMEDNQNFYYYSHPIMPMPERHYQFNTNYSVIFGKYNAYVNPYALSGKTVSTITEYAELNGTGGEYLNTFTSFYNPDLSAFNAEQENLYRLVFHSSFDSSNDNNMKCDYDEGDFSLNKIVVVGAGKIKTNNAIKGHSPAEYASRNFDYGTFLNRINLFSIEKDSYQLVHNNSEDRDTNYLTTNVVHLPGMFAVRGQVPVNQKYYYVKNGTGKTLKSNNNRYNLQNAIYGTSGMYIPRTRSSNDNYKLPFSSLYDLIEGDYKKMTKTHSFDNVNRAKDGMAKTYVYHTIGILDGIKLRYNIYFDDIVKYFKKFGVTIPTTNNNTGNDSKLYRIYIVNENPEKSITMNCTKYLGPGQPKTQLVKSIKPGKCLKLLYKCNGQNNEEGILNI